MATKDQKYFKELGARLREARKARDMTQVALAKELGVAQQTLAHYEVGRVHIPLATLIAMSQILRFSLDEMLLLRASARSRPGPASRLELQMEAIIRLPKARQRIIADVLDGLLAQKSA